MRLLKGDETGAVSVQGDQVVLDVSEVIDQVKQRLVERGLTIVQNVPIPDDGPADRADGGAAAEAGCARSTRSRTRWPSGCSWSSRCSTWPRSCCPAAGRG